MSVASSQCIKYDRPAFKLHAKDVLTMKNIGGVWKEHETGVELSLVWLQGQVMTCTDDLQKVELEDEGCIVSVTGCQSIPGGTAWISHGQYVMVIGEVECRGSVKAVKIVNLSMDQLHKKIWQREVNEAKTLISENPQLFT